MGLKDIDFDALKRPMVWEVMPEWSQPNGRVRIRLVMPLWTSKLTKMHEWCVKHECGYVFRGGHDDEYYIEFPSKEHYIMFNLAWSNNESF